MKAGAGEVDPFFILLVCVVLAALALGYGLHKLYVMLERRRAKRNETADLQSRAIAIIEPRQEP